MATWTWEYGEAGTGLHFTIVYDTDAGTFTVTSLEGKFDLNALWWDDGTSAGSDVKLSKQENALNMNGSGEDWDGMMKLSNAGLGKEGEDKNSFISENETAVFSLADFGITGDFDVANGGTLGVRATSVNGGDSIKLVDKEPVFDDGETEEDPDDFPLWPQDISNIVLYFDQTAGDVKPVNDKPDGNPKDTQPDGDGYYVVKIDGWPGDADDDLDNSIEAILAWLIENDPNIDADSDLLGAAIKGGTETTKFYAYGDHNTNGTDPDPFPAGAPTADGGPGGNVTPTSIDESYNYSQIFV